MKIYEDPDPSWPSKHGRMEHRPIAVVVKGGRIISAYLYEEQDEYGLLGETTSEWHSGESWSTA